MVSAVINQVVAYRARNLVNGKHYIGITKCGLAVRERQHRNLARSGKGKRLHAALRKHGDEAFVFEQIFDFDGDVELAFIYEAEAIEKERPAYNAAPGGWLSAESLEKVKNGTFRARKRRKMTLEEKARRRELMAKHPHPFKGKHHSPKSIAQLSESKKGSPGFWTGKKRPLEHYSSTVRSVICLEDGRVFPSISEAERYYGLRRDSVGTAIRSAKEKSVRGLHFQYVVKK